MTQRLAPSDSSGWGRFSFRSAAKLVAMRSVPMLALALVACSGADPVDVPADAGIADASPFDTTDIQGRVCSVIDLRYPWACPPAGSVGGISVRERILDQEVITGTDGLFGFDLPSNARDSIFEVLGDDRVPVLVEALAANVGNVIAPVISLGPWQGYLAVMNGGDQEMDAYAYVLVAVIGNDGERIERSSIVPPQGHVGETYYNLGDAFVWDTVGFTSTTGVALLTGVPVEENRITLTVRGPDDADVKTVDVEVEAGTLSFVSVELNL